MQTARPAMLGLIGMGFPITQRAIRRFGRRGAILVEALTLALLAQDLTELAAGKPDPRRRVPARLLYLETAVAGVALAAGLPVVLDQEARQHAVEARPTALEALRRLAIGSLFGIHTLRFRISLRGSE